MKVFIFFFKYTLDPNHFVDQGIVFILGQTEILNFIFLKSNKLNIFIHESLLPKGKGFSPTQYHALLNTLIMLCFNFTMQVLCKSFLTFSGFSHFQFINNHNAYSTEPSQSLYVVFYFKDYFFNIWNIRCFITQTTTANRQTLALLRHFVRNYNFHKTWYLLLNDFGE